MQKSLSFHTFFYLVSFVIMRGSGIIAKIFLARTITPYEYGLITLLVIALPGLFQLITNFCFFDILGHSTEGKKYFSFSLIYGSIATAIIATFFILFPQQIFQFLNIEWESWPFWTIILIGSLYSVTIAGFIVGILRGGRDHSLAGSFSAAPSILRVVFIIIAIYIFNITNFYVIMFLFALPPIIILIPVLLYKRETIRDSFRSILIPNRNMLMFGFSFFIINAWVSLSQHINSVVISHDLGLEWQGYFDVSLSVVAVMLFFSGAFYLISVPETTRNSNNKEILTKSGGLGDIGRLLLSMCLLCVLIIYFYSHQLVIFLFSSEYSIAGDYLIILAIGYTILFIQQYCAFLSIPSDNEGISKLTTLTILSIAAFPFFTSVMIHKFEFMGAYLATAGLITVYTLFSLILIKDHTPIKLLFVKFERLALSFGLTWLVLYFFPLPLFIGLISSTVLFCILIVVFSYIDINLIKNLVQINEVNPKN